jgi:hypothetical protein
MKSKILGIAVTILAIAMLASPVMAIGPFQALEVGNNKNLVIFGASVGNTRGGAGGSSYWMWVDGGQHWIKWQFKDASQAKGVMETAIIPDTTNVLPNPTSLGALFTSLSEDELNNKWIYLSGDGPSYPSQISTHGTLYWFTFSLAKMNGASNTIAANMAASIVADYPAGEFWMHIDIAVP